MVAFEKIDLAVGLNLVEKMKNRARHPPFMILIGSIHIEKLQTVPFEGVVSKGVVSSQFWIHQLTTTQLTTD